MKSLCSLSVAAALLFSGQTLAATEIAGIELPGSVMMQDTQLTLNGAGVRSKFFMDLYVGSLYLPTAAHDLKQVLAEPSALVRLNITSGLITADKMRDAINEGFELATDGDISAIKPQITEFMGLFDEAIQEGDQFSFLTTANSVTSYKNGKLLSTIEGEAFRTALLSIWLGDDPAQNSLKKAMLGH
ncbi:chalcone isomerase family protein [Shewanella sp. GXUN23E]|uniref:chalcone isomerase family protein n=1 Tax=Shewanella sp. GXUN23E TaxID=3422498 RepID=UPI003D7EB788